MARGNPFRLLRYDGARWAAAPPRTLLQHNWKLPVPDNRNRDLPGTEDGSALIEMALTLPILFALFFCFMELCLAFYSHEMISESAREGTRYAMVRGASCPTSANPTCEVTAAQVNAYVSGNGWPHLGSGTMTVATSYPDGDEAVNHHVQVTVTYVFKITMQFVPKNSIAMSSTSKRIIVQ
jgi:Flp pilus assembly protein TadG